MTTLAMTTIDSLLHRINDGIAVLRSAVAAAAAVDSGREPARMDLEVLGIDPRAFSSIGHG